MAKLSLFTLGLTLAITLVSTNDPGLSDQNFRVEFITSDKLTDLLKEGNYKEMPVKNLSHQSTGKYTFVYQFGKRTSNDWFITQDAQNHTWSGPHNVQIKLQYPENGTGYIVTYVEVCVTQTTDVSRAYVVSGGIGHRKIAIVVEGRDTILFNYKADLYGRN